MHTCNIVPVWIHERGNENVWWMNSCGGPQLNVPEKTKGLNKCLNKISVELCLLSFILFLQSGLVLFSTPISGKSVLQMYRQEALRTGSVYLTGNNTASLQTIINSSSWSWSSWRWRWRHFCCKCGQSAVFLAFEWFLLACVGAEWQL